MYFVTLEYEIHNWLKEMVVKHHVTEYKLEMLPNKDGFIVKIDNEIFPEFGGKK